jgi:hypothetical protein
VTSTDLAARYGTAAPWRRHVLVGAASLVVVTFAAWLGWVIWQQSQPEVASGNLTFDEASSDREIVARFDVDMDDGVEEATCTLQAYGKAGATRVLVGNLTFTVPAGTTRVEQAVATERRATAVELVGCTAPGQKRPR